MKINQIAAQLYTLCDYLKTEQEFEVALKKLNEIGYTAIQLSGLGFSNYKFIKDTAEKYGMNICATHLSFDRLAKEFDEVVKEHKAWGCKYIGISSFPEHYPKKAKGTFRQYEENAEGYTRFAKDASEMGRKLKQNDLNLVYHNHSFEFEKFGGITGLDILLNESDPDALGFEIDTYWVVIGGENPIDWINKVKGRMGIIHFKDLAIQDEKQIMAEVGEGNLDWAGIIKACDVTGVTWAAVEQDVCQRDPFDSMRISFNNIKNMI